MAIEVLTLTRGLFVVSIPLGYAKHLVRARYKKYRAFFCAYLSGVEGTTE